MSIQEILGFLWEVPVIAFAAFAVLAVILPSVYTHLSELVSPPPIVPPENWSAREVVRRPKVSCLAYLVLAVSFLGIAGSLLPLHLGILGALAIAMAILVSIAMFAEMTTSCRNPLFVLTEQGIESKYGMIPWSEIVAIRLALPPFGIRAESSALFLYVPNATKYRKRLSLWQTLNAGIVRSEKYNDVIAFGLEGLNQKPSYIFAAAERLHRHALHQLGRSPKTKTGVARLDDLHEQLDALNTKIQSVRDDATVARLTAQVEQVTNKLRQANEQVERTNKRRAKWLVAVAIVVYAAYFLSRYVWK